jgi:hypothetical protein
LIGGVMLLTIFEGAFRKWAFASNPMLRYATYFSKDVLFVYAAYVGLRHRSFFDMSWLAACAALIVLPSVGSTLMSLNPVGVLLSLRAYLIIPACAYLAASLVKDFRDIERCALLVAGSAIFVAILSTYQYSLPPSHFLNRYDSSTEDSHIVAVIGHVRATGTFAFISGMSMLAGCAAWAGTFLALPLSGRPFWVRLVGLAAIVAGFGCCTTAMIRSGLLFWGVTLIGGCLLYFRPKQIAAVVIALLLVSPFLSGGEEDVNGDTPRRSDSLTSGLVHRIENGDSVVERGTYMFNNFYWGMTRHPLGEGLGSGQPGGAHAAGKETQGLGYESEWGRIAFEVGPIGLTAVLLIRFATFRRCWHQFTRAADEQTRLVLATGLPFFGIMSLGWMAFNHTGNSFAWTVIALSLGAAYGRCWQVETMYKRVSPLRVSRASSL